jgi:hypothetical protein
MGHRVGLFTAVVVVLVALAAGGLGYNIGVSHGLALTASAAGTAGAAPYMAPYMFYRPWGFGFGPLLFLLLFFFVFRMGLWGGLYRRGRSDLPMRFEEWHRRAHEQMNNSQPRPDTLG